MINYNTQPKWAYSSFGYLGVTDQYEYIEALAGENPDVDIFVSEFNTIEEALGFLNSINKDSYSNELIIYSFTFGQHMQVLPEDEEEIE